jgi:hypothetical protein
VLAFKRLSGQSALQIALNAAADGTKPPSGADVDVPDRATDARSGYLSCSAAVKALSLNLAAHETRLAMSRCWAGFLDAAQVQIVQLAVYLLRPST